MKRQSGLPEKNKLQFVSLLAMKSRDHKAILDVFVKQDVKLIDVLVQKVSFCVIK